MRQEPDATEDALLISRLAAGEDLALDILMKRYQEPLYYFILRYVHDEDLAYDLVQETFYRVYTKAASFKTRYRFTTWLYQIALNLCRDHGRKLAIRKLFSLSVHGPETRHHSSLRQESRIEEDFDTDADIRELHRQIALLPHKLKAALLLYSLEENNQARCSEILGVSKKTVETRVYRAKQILRKKITRHSEGSS